MKMRKRTPLNIVFCLYAVYLVACSSVQKETDPELVKIENSVNNSDFDPNKKYEYGETLLHKEAHAKFQKPNLRIMRQLIHRGADVNATDDFGNTPLHVCRDLEAAILLVDSGASFCALNKHGFNPLDTVCGEAAKLASLDGDNIDWVVDVAEFLIQRGAKFSEKFKLQDFKCKRLTLLVLKHGGVELLRMPYEMDCAEYDVGSDPASIAAINNDFSYLKALINNGAYFKVAHHDSEPRSLRGLDGHPLIFTRNPKIAKYLLRKGAHIDDPAFMHCTTLLRETTAECDLKMIKFCLDHGAYIDAVGGTGGSRETPLMIACSQCGGAGRSHAKNATPKKYFNIVKLLVEHGADINKTDCWGENALLRAVQCGDLTCIEYLLQHGADIDRTKKYNGDTVWQVAAEQENAKEIIAFLRKYEK
jgi:ankyrin repeat protein